MCKHIVVARSPSSCWAQAKLYPFTTLQQTKTRMRLSTLSLLTIGAVCSSVKAFAPSFVTKSQNRFIATQSVSTTTTSSLAMADVKLSQDELKKQVGYKAVDDYVKSGMTVGLGTGSTAYYAVERVGELLKSGELKDIVAIPTSVRTKEQAESLGIPLVTLDTHSKLDVAIDGADEVDPDLNLVKGGGGALLREKMVEVMADKFIVIGAWKTKGTMGRRSSLVIINCQKSDAFLFLS